MLDPKLLRSDPAAVAANLARRGFKLDVERMRREFPTITLPVFILHGTADKATVPAGSQFFYDTAGSRDKTLRLYPDHAHDLLNDVGKHAVLNDIAAWVAARL